MKTTLLLILALAIPACAQTAKPKKQQQKKKEVAIQWCDPSFGASMTDGWHQYVCVPDKNGPAGKRGHWDEDKQAEAEIARVQQHKYELARALTTRVLTAKELQEVLDYGPDIFTQNMVPFYQKDIDEQFVTALKIQVELRAMASQH